MTIDLGLMLAGMLLIGFLAQWLAWRVKLPAILFLLLAGILLGPVSGVLVPDRLLGALLFPTVSLAVALILFEGSLSLRLHELPAIGRMVRGLVSYGAVSTLLLLALAAHLVAGLSWSIALLFGALACVTGPTVIAPMLRTVRPNARIANTLRWEGIVIDPLGALFAVLIYEAIVSRQQGHTLGIFALTIGCGAVIGLLAAWLTGFLLRRQLIPEYLQNYAVLAAVLFAFSVSNVLAHESGLLAVTLMGTALGNLRGVHIDDILDFKENLTTVLVSVLFILLAARLQWPLPDGMLGAGIALFVIAQLVVRPLAVALASIGAVRAAPACAGHGWRQRAGAAGIHPDHRHGGAAERHRAAAGALAESGRAGAARRADLRLRRRGPGDRSGARRGGFSRDAGRRRLGGHPPGAHGRARHVLRQPRLAARRAPSGSQRHRPPAGGLHPS